MTMQGDKLAVLMTALSDHASHCGQDDSAMSWTALAELVRKFPKATSAALRKAIATAVEELPTGQPLPAFLKDASEVKHLFDAASAKSAAKIIQDFSDALLKARGSSVGGILSAADDKLSNPPAKKQKADPQKVVDQYVPRLTDALGNDDKFSCVIADLTGDKTANLAVLKLIAKQFSGASQPKTKKSALNAIKYRHESIMLDKAKAAATAGRTAA